MNISEKLNGLDLAAHLDAEAFEGLVCVLSASEQSTADAWRERPGIDLVLEKGTAIDTVKDQVLSALSSRRARGQVRVRRSPLWERAPECV